VFKEWQYYFLKTISWVCCLLKYQTVLAVGRQLGKLFYLLAARQRKRALRQIEEYLAVPPEEATEIGRNLFIKLGQTFSEVLYTPKLNKKNIAEFVRIEGRQYLDNALAEGKGVIVLAAHFGNWEWLGAALALYGYPVASVIKKQPNDQHTRILNEYRREAGIEVFARGTAEVVAAVKTLKKGKILGFFADQDAGRSGVFVDFFGKLAATPLGPATFARKLRCPVLPGVILRNPAGGHTIIINPPLEFEFTDHEELDLHRLTRQMVKVTEGIIRRFPDEWLWFQKRWTTRPEKVGWLRRK
jgi:KDO2-lipid IV(A) lauroyltransferase